MEAMDLNKARRWDPQGERRHAELRQLHVLLVTHHHRAIAPDAVSFRQAVLRGSRGIDHLPFVRLTPALGDTVSEARHEHMPTDDRRPNPPSSELEIVLLARHGETEWNRLGIRQGQLDSGLTGRGRAQAARLAATLADQRPDRVFTSPLGRAAITARLCGDRLGLEVMVLDELAEVHHGEMAGLTATEIEERFPGQMAERAADRYEWRFPGGESYADADRRGAIALDRIAASGSLRPLVVSHAMIGRVLLRRLVGADPTTALAWDQPHDIVYRVDPVRLTYTRIKTDAAE
jgi:broad specificity phosphatase PhoE